MPPRMITGSWPPLGIRFDQFLGLVTLGNYFGNKNMANVRFASIANTIDVRDHQIKIPKMEINSTLGFMRIEGSQDFEGI